MILKHIKAVKMYQGVKFGQDTITFIDMDRRSEEDTRLGRTPCVAEVEENGVLLRVGQIGTLITWNNIQYLEYQIEEVPESKSKSK